MGEEGVGVKKAFSVTVVFIAVCLLLCGCSFQPFQPVEELMHPPYDSDYNQDLLAAFQTSVNGTPVLLPPSGGEYTSAIVLYDFDGDGEEEALVFYKIKSVSDTARMNVLDTVDGEWQSVADIKGNGTVVDSLRFVHMDSDGDSELIVCWRVGNTTGRILSVFHKDKATTSFKELVTEAHAVMTVADFDGDGFDDVFYISQENGAGGNHNTATLVKMSKGEGDESQIVELSSARLDSNVVSYSSLQFSDTSGTTLFADAVKGEDSMITEVIRWNQSTGELEVPFLDKTTLSNTATLRTPLIPSMDIDLDGVVEIPTQHPLLPEEGAKSSSAGEESQPVMMTEWMEEKGGTLVSKAYTVINARLSYIYTFNENDIGNIFIRQETEDCWIFYRLDDDRKVSEDLFSVIPVAKADWDEKNNERYTVLADCGNNYICAYISDAGNAAAINTGALEEQFRVFVY